MAIHLRKIIHTKRYLWRIFGAVYCVLMVCALFNGSSRVQMSMPSYVTDPVFVNSVGENKCRVNMDVLGSVKVDFSFHPNISDLEAANPTVMKGGQWEPSDCTAWQKVALIVPYRDRYEHLKVLLHRLHPMLQRQKLHYHIFLLEQFGNEEFNRGKLMNVGVKEALKIAPFDCFVFQDVDLLPENDQNLYYCDDQARHLASAIDEMRYHVMYYNYAGGVIAMNKKNFFLLNGYSNGYWGWGNEDDDFSARIMESGLLLTRPPENIGRFKMVRHAKSWRSDHGYDLFLTWKSRWRSDGINNLDSAQYRVVEVLEPKLYTHIIVDVGKPPEKPPINKSMPRVSLFWFLQFFFP